MSKYNITAKYIFNLIPIILFAVALLSFTEAAYAAAQVDEVITKFQDVLKSPGAIKTFLISASKNLFWVLGSIQITWNFYQLVLEGKIDLQSIVLCLLKNVIILAVMWFFLAQADRHFTMIVDTFMDKGKIYSGSGSMSGLINLGTDTTSRLLKSVGQVQGSWGAKIPAYIVAALCSIVILLSFSLAVLTMIIGLCKLYLSALIALYFVGFASLDYTRGIAITAYKSVYCAGVEVFVTYILFGIANEIFPSFFSSVSSMTTSDIIPLCLQLVVATFVFSGAVKTLPSFASGIVAGSPLGGGMQAGAGAALAGAVAGGVATGIATVAGAGVGAVGGVKLAGAMGGGKLSKLGHGLAGAMKGGYGGEKGELGNFMRRRAYKSYERTFGPDYENSSQAQQAQAHNNITPPSGNSNNVNP